MKKLTFSLLMIAACSFGVSNSYAQDFSLSNISNTILRGPGGGGSPGHGSPNHPGNPPGGGNDHGGNPGHGNPGHGGGNDHHGGGGHGGGGGFPGHGNPGHGGPGFPGNPGHQPRPVILTCSSGGYNFQRCFVRGRIYRADLARQRSQAACIQGRTWGYDGNSVWVNRGCKGDFAVYLGF